MAANNLGSKSSRLRQRDRFRKLASGGNYVMTAPHKLVCEWTKEGNVRRVCQVDPDSHWLSHCPEVTTKLFNSTCRSFHKSPRAGLLRAKIFPPLRQCALDAG